MTVSGNELADLKMIGGLGVSFYVIKELFKYIHYQAKQKKEEKIQPREEEYKRDSRLKIRSTSVDVSHIREKLDSFVDPLLEIKKQVGETHRIVTKDDKGTPLIYNPNLDKSVEKLIEIGREQTALLKQLRDSK